jgi:ATP-dependent protease HslVU (ClpYQ) peptidase subunit
MTWIVGVASPVGYALSISDIRVTFRDGSEKDCLQKLYPMARFIAAGFAGSVKIGFTMLDALAYQLRDAPENMAFFPQEVADCFAPLAKDIFRSIPLEDRSGGSHLMILGAHPTEDLGIPGWARCVVNILRSPEFTPETAKIGEVVSIGSGSVYPPYSEVLLGFSSDPMSLYKLEPAGFGASSVLLSLIIQKTIERNPVPGISAHAHMCLVSRRFMDVRPNDEDIYPPTGEKIEFRMPPVATNWDEFVRIASQNHKSAIGAIC